MRVLLAEDDVVSRVILQRTVELLGHQTLVASDGLGAWTTYQQNAGDVDVVISDWMMPGLAGPELCEKVREHDGSRKIAAERIGGVGYPFFVLLSDMGDNRDAEVGRWFSLEGMRAGADDFLKKPLDREELEVRLMTAERITSLQRRHFERRRELENHNGELLALAGRDPATKLGSRSRLGEDLRSFRARVDRYGHSCCAIICGVNPPGSGEGCRQPADDETLRKVAAVIERTFRVGDVAYRYGSEEFVIILPEQTLETAAIASDRLRRHVEALAISGDTGMPTLSCGLAELSPGSEKSVMDLLNELDVALRDARGDLGDPY